MTTYSISLDKVDLALLPLPTHTFNDFLKKENYQFEVMKSAPEPTTRYTCHICAIEVPVAFAYEHASSIKHQANVRIASVAAERMRAFISALPPTFAAKPTARFCTSCATEVDEGHEKTKEHRAAAILDKLLWDLMKAYVQDDEPKYDHEQTHEDSDKGKNNDYKNDENSINLHGENQNNSKAAESVNNDEPNELIEDKAEIIDEEEQIETYCEICQAKITENDIEDEQANLANASTEETENNQSTNLNPPKNVVEKGINVNWLEHYEENLRQFLDEDDYFEYKESVKISINFNDYKLKNIDSDSFHSYEKMVLSDYLLCIVCDCVLDYEEAEVHKDDFEHLSKIAKLGNDGHFVREIDEIYSHCIVCNIKIKNEDMETHIESGSHKCYAWGHTNSCDIVKPKTEDTKTEKISNEDGDGALHNDKNTAHITVPLNASDKNIGPEIEYPYEVTATGIIRCVVCECQVPRGVQNREEHIKGFRHRTTVLNKNTAKPLEDTTEEKEAETSNNSVTRDKDYGEELRKYVDDKHIFEFKEISTCDIFRLRLNDIILKTYTVRFHSFGVINRKFMCQICNCDVDSEDQEEHKYQEQHMRKVANLEDDGHFVRKISLFRRHCILCNAIIHVIDEAKHKQSQKHLNEQAKLVKHIDDESDEDE